MLDSIYHMPLKLLKISFLALKCEDSQSFTQHLIGRHYVIYIICNPLVVYGFHCMALYHSQMQYHVINRLSNQGLN